jgi:hypothetical protein
VKRPNRLRVGSRRYIISEGDPQMLGAAQAAALVQHSTGVIVYDPEYAAECIAESLLHEALHCCFNDSGINLDREKEEWIVSTLSPRLAALIADNPKFFEYLLAELVRKK